MCKSVPHATNLCNVHLIFFLVFYLEWDFHTLQYDPLDSLDVRPAREAMQTKEEREAGTVCFGGSVGPHCSGILMEYYSPIMRYFHALLFTPGHLFVRSPGGEQIQICVSQKRFNGCPGSCAKQLRIQA